MNPGALKESYLMFSFYMLLFLFESAETYLFHNSGMYFLLFMPYAS
jgi:hypothetical protein